MNPYQFRGTCDVCGGEGAATSDVAAAAWRAGSNIRHKDPQECADVLAARRRELDERDAAQPKEPDDGRD